MRIDSSGLILLHPFLVKFFIKLYLIKNGEFVNLQSKERAVGILQYIVNDQKPFNNQQAHLAKILCGIAIDELSINQYPVDDGVKMEVHSLLEEVIHNWPALKNTSPNGFREAFLSREGELIVDADSAKLKVERRTIDILLNSLPWNISIVKLPFQKMALMVEW